VIRRRVLCCERPRLASVECCVDRDGKEDLAFGLEVGGRAEEVAKGTDLVGGLLEAVLVPIVIGQGFLPLVWPES
jgi:hypothetical protein